MVQYNFLVLSALLFVPGLVVFVLRPDLRRAILTVAPFSLPFALTEFLFYPDYWEPVFLFDLIHILGFGIEDVLFVVGLAAFTTTVYPFFTGRTYALQAKAPPLRSVVGRGLLLVLLCLAVTAGALFARIPAIYACLLAMASAFVGVLMVRRDLALPGAVGALLSMLVYTGICLVFAWIYPDIFVLAWKTDKLSALFVLGVPIEELLYAFAAGAVATVFYPFVFGRRFVPLPARRSAADGGLSAVPSGEGPLRTGSRR